MLQNDTQSDLSPTQTQALELLIAGATVTGTADQVGVSRSTVHRCLRDDYDFRAAINRAKRLLVGEAETRLLTLLESALKVVEGAIEAGDTRTALMVLKGVGLLSGQSCETGHEDADTLRRHDEVVARETESDLGLRGMVLGF